MKLYPLEPSSRLITNIARISKEIKMNVLILTKGADIPDPDTLVVLSDGLFDDIASSLIAYYLNGDKIAGIVKSKRTRFGAIDLLPTYLKGAIRKIVFLIDQEDDSLNTIYKNIQRRLEKLATGEIDIVGEENEKVKVYKGKYGSREFELTLIVNGLADIQTDKHSTEDHFLKAAEMISIEVGEFENSKKAWESITHDERLKIFKELKANRELMEGVFPQQVQGCNYLMK